MSTTRRREVLCLGVLALIVFVPHASSQRMGRDILDPKTYKSPSGQYELRVDPSTIYGQGEGSYRMTREGAEVWAKTLPFTLWDAALTDDGTVAGYAYSLGRENAPLRQLGPHDPFSSVEGKLLIVILEPEGGIRLNAVLPRRGMESCTTRIDRNVSGFVLDPENDRFIVRTRESGRISLEETWRTFRLSSGTMLDEFIFTHPHESERESWFLLAARPVAGTPLLLVNWDYDKWAEDGNSIRASGGCFALIDATGNAVWELDRPNDYPKDFLYEHRTTGAVLRADQPRQFDAWFVKEGQRVTFEVARDGETWRVSELARAAYTPTAAAAPPSEPASLQPLTLEHVGTITLQTDSALPPEIRSIKYFDIDDRGQVGFLRQERDRSTTFVLVDPNGDIARQVGLADAFGDDYMLPTATWVGGQRWVVIVETLHDDPGRDRKASLARAWWLDVESQTLTAIDPFSGQNAREVAATRDGGFVVSIKAELGTNAQDQLAAFGSDGRERWRIVPYSEDILGLTVTTDGRIITQHGFGDRTFSVTTRDGNVAETRNSRDLFGKDRASVESITADSDGGLVVAFGTAAPRIWRVKSDWTVREKLEPRHPDKRLVQPPGGFDDAAIRVDHAGTIWVCDGRSFLRLKADGVVERILGEAPDAPHLRRIGGVTIDQQGNTYLAEARNAITHVFDSEGRRVRMLRPQPDDFERIWDVSIDVAGDGRVFLNGLEFSPTGERVGFRKLPAGVDEPVHLFGSGVRYQPHSRLYWVVSLESATLVSAENSVLRTVRRRSDGNWLDQISASAVAPDGGLALASESSTFGKHGTEAISVCTPAGEPRITAPLPDVLASRPPWENLAYSGRYVLIGPWQSEHGHYALLDTAVDPPQWYDVGRLEPYEDSWHHFFVKDGQELWMFADEARKVERYALPDQATSASTSQPAPRSFTPSDLVAQYYFGDGLGVNCYLTLGGDGRFSFKWRGCLGTYDENVGAWDIVDGLVVLKPEKPNKREGFRGTATRMYPIRWGERLYLVPDDEMIDFCRSTSLDYVFGKDGFQGGRSAFYYMRAGDEEAAFSDSPLLPVLYQRYLKEPFAGAVLKVDGDGSFVIDRGQADGLVVGTRLRVTGADEFGYAVATLTEHTATCVARSPKARAGLVKVGAKVGPFMGE